MTEDQIGHCVRIALAKANMSVLELAAKLLVSRQTAHSYTKGKNDNISRLTDIAEACDMTYGEMMKLAD